ncbi:hypothetical protein BJ170DRAFT_690941 [Xylariales sp. AK1849]|nr:hypothetical protein BJ170DRAFT_690941 [Xylariales sp. AK1849]
MESSEDHLKLILEQIDYMEAESKVFRRREGKYKPGLNERVRDLEEQNGRFPPLPPRLPRPEYVLNANSLDRDEESLKFFFACKQGIMPEIVAFVEKQSELPSQVVRQYGLEQASFGSKSEVARYLLEKGTMLHSYCFMRSIKIERSPSGMTSHNASLFDGTDDEDTEPLIKLLQAFIEVQGFLLNHGADPNLARYLRGAKDSACVFAIDRQSPNVLNSAVRDMDSSLIELLIRHGAKSDCEGLHLLHSLVKATGPRNFAEKRRPLAEYFLDRGLADVNAAKQMPWKHEGTMLYLGGYTEEHTPLTYACAASDWDFVEWLLEKGADPDALSGKAYEEQWWMKPRIGPNDPSKLTELVDKIRKRRGGEEVKPLISTTEA